MYFLYAGVVQNTVIYLLKTFSRVFQEMDLLYRGPSVAVQNFDLLLTQHPPALLSVFIDNVNCTVICF